MRKQWIRWIAPIVLLCGVAIADECAPFYADIEKPGGSFFAVRPFYSHTELKERSVTDYLWPLYSRKTFLDEKTSRGLLMYWTHQFGEDSETVRRRRWLLPFWFDGRDAQGESYKALFPFYGNIHEFIGRDKLSFCLFPLYGTGQINEVKTTNVLWPIYSKTRGDGIERDRVFPFVGRTLLADKYEKKFVLWPFWTSAKYLYPGDSGNAWMLFPLYGRTELDQESTSWVLPPFFRFTEGMREDRMYCPWPFIQRVDSEGYQRRWVWPFWGRDTYGEATNTRSFALWPFLRSERSINPKQIDTRKRLVPFVTLHKICANDPEVAEEDQAVLSSYWQVWPLMSFQEEGERSRFRLLDLWPIKNSAPIERNWAPLWTLYKRVSENGVVQKDALWFIWHSETCEKESRSEWSILKGLVSCKKDEQSTSGRFLYIFKFGE